MRQSRLQLLLALLAIAGGFQRAQASGHFIYGAISWARPDPSTYDVTFTIKSAWVKSYEGFARGTNFSEPVFLTGFKTPTFTIYNDTTNRSTYLEIKVKSMMEPGEQYGDWIEGTSEVKNTYDGPGTYVATFSGCCVADANGQVDFLLETTVELDKAEPAFSPSLMVLPVVYFSPGGSVTIPALHPRGLLDAGTYRWEIPTARTIPGFNVDSMGIVRAAGNVQHGTYHLYVEVSLLHYEGDDCTGGCLTGATSSVFFTVVILSPGLSPTLTTEDADSDYSSSPDKILIFRTGFPLHIDLNIHRTHANSTLLLRTSSLLPRPLSVSFDQPAGVVSLGWDKPCVGEAVEAVYCITVMELPHTLNVSSQMCLRIRVLEDEAPAFKELQWLDGEAGPVPGEPLTWIMGRERSFSVNVEDEADMDKVLSLDLSPDTPLPAGADLLPTQFMGNTAHRVLKWLPLQTAGGGSYELCFITSDTPGVTYESCRLGARTASQCYAVRVLACRYAVRPQESMSDVAARFNTDWVQLWALNPDITSPDSQLGYRPDLHARGAVVNTGHLYTAGSGDSVAAVAYKFGMTVKYLVNLNANFRGMRDKDPLQEGSEVCILPNSCLRD
mmetsp:Transcript_72059/g.150557  ORF Transcript_72059/g.150557 Transcript_72059/m.150557 type:complete len:612 (+) Transcript_72059:157-1992(+)